MNEKNIHVQQKRRQNIITQGIDCGLHGRFAEMAIREYLTPGTEIIEKNIGANLPDIVMIQDGIEFYIEVKTGSANLGTINNKGEWEILNFADAVTYCPELDTNLDIISQFYVFTKDEFLEMWEKLGLIRKKVSTKAMKNYRIEYGSESKCNVDEYADMISIQSFKNSEKKYSMVLEWCEKMPKLNQGGKAKINKLINNKYNLTGKDAKINYILKFAEEWKNNNLSTEDFVTSLKNLI